MIRFINLTGQILIDDDELHFAWFDTITDEFMVFAGTQDWHSWEEFKQDLLTQYHIIEPTQEEIEKVQKMIDRFKRLYQFKTSPTNSDPSSKE